MIYITSDTLLTSKLGFGLGEVVERVLHRVEGGRLVNEVCKGNCTQEQTREIDDMVIMMIMDQIVV